MWLAALVAFVPAVVLPWMTQRVVRADPLWGPRTRGSRWVRRNPAAPLHARHRFRSDRGDRRRIALRRAVRIPVTVLLLVGWGLGVKDLRNNVEFLPGEGKPDRPIAAEGDPTDGNGIVAAQLSKEPWFDEHNRAWQQLERGSQATQSVGFEFPTVRTPTLTTVDGVRRTWAPPPTTTCTAPVRVWFFGGSAMWGVGQRDDHTIPSYVVKAAYRDGIALDVENRAFPGDVAWQELWRLRIALANAPQPPQVVVTYDGFNDMRAVEWAYRAGLDVDGEFRAMHDQRMLQVVNRLRVQDFPEDGPLTVADVDIDARPPDEAKIRRAGIAQYVAAIEIGTRMLADLGVEFVPSLQPVLATRSPLVRGDPPTSRLAQGRAGALRRAAPDNVLDLTDALDDEQRPVYIDDVHTDERGARVVGERMWSELRPTVLPLATANGCGVTDGP